MLKTLKRGSPIWWRHPESDTLNLIHCPDSLRAVIPG